jgi:RNA polymerase sigma factor (sigma-70 family)
MIFDSEKVGKLIQSWKISRDKETLEQIIIETHPLASFIASKSNICDREDMIQEALIKVCSALEVYDPTISNPHTYFSTVIRNVCCSYAAREGRHESMELDDDTKGITYEYIVNDTMEELIERNRIRFPTVPVDIIDCVTEHIYYGIRDEIHQNKTLNDIVKDCIISRSIANTIYNSTIAYLRNKYFQYANMTLTTDEISLLPELLEVVGPEAYEKMRVVFNNITLRL